MKRVRKFLSWIFIILVGVSCTTNMTVKSPDKNNIMTLSLNEEGTLFYSIQSHGTKTIGLSLMGFDIDDSTLNFNSGLNLIETKRSLIDETYILPTGKTSTYYNRGNEAVFIFKNRFNNLLYVVCRAYKDGIAFRYEVESNNEITVKKEYTGFSIPQKTLSWMMDYSPAYESFYFERMIDTIGIKPLSFPSLMLIDKKIWLLLTEASIYDQPATHLIKNGTGNELRIELPEEQYSVMKKWNSPWRTFIMGTDLATIIESTMVENLNPPSVLSDVSWIKPGLVVFPWWGNYMANSYIDTLKAYVDLAAEMNWEWIEFDVSLVGSPFRSSKLWQNTEWLPYLTNYAKSKGINVYGWDEINVLKSEDGWENVLRKYQDLGIKGIKIDYINSDKQDAMCFRNDAMNDTGQKKMMVSFHGETLPRGQRRTYPNFMTAEAVLGAEYYTFKEISAPTPKHNCILPFTRNVVGPMDYTPVTFTIRPENPRKTTYAHELALAVVFESGWMVMADRPEAYLNSPAKEILKELESTWHKTLFIEGYPGDYICLARRKNDKWFVAGINSEQERTVQIPLSFVGGGDYLIDIYEDKPGEEMTTLNIRKERGTSDDTLTIKMMSNGGFCTMLRKSTD